MASFWTAVAEAELAWQVLDEQSTLSTCAGGRGSESRWCTSDSTAAHGAERDAPSGTATASSMASSMASRMGVDPVPRAEEPPRATPAGGGGDAALYVFRATARTRPREGWGSEVDTGGDCELMKGVSFFD